MTSIGAAKFKEQCLSLLEHLEPDGVIITKHGRPIARLLPYDAEPGRLIGILKGRIAIHGDLLSTGVRWDALGRQ